jgi:hypothetical protein
MISKLISSSLSNGFELAGLNADIKVDEILVEKKITILRCSILQLLGLHYREHYGWPNVIKPMTGAIYKCSTL